MHSIPVCPMELHPTTGNHLRVPFIMARLLRLADLELGYTFKKNWIAPIGMKSLRIYCLANNVALFAPWDMWDPETASFNGSKYPLPRKVNIGIRASF